MSDVDLILLTFFAINVGDGDGILSSLISLEARTFVTSAYRWGSERSRLSFRLFLLRWGRGWGSVLGWVSVRLSLTFHWRCGLIGSCTSFGFCCPFDFWRSLSTLFFDACVGRFVIASLGIATGLWFPAQVSSHRDTLRDAYPSVRRAAVRAFEFRLRFFATPLSNLFATMLLLGALPTHYFSGRIAMYTASLFSARASPWTPSHQTSCYCVIGQKWVMNSYCSIHMERKSEFANSYCSIHMECESDWRNSYCSIHMECKSDWRTCL